MSAINIALKWPNFGLRKEIINSQLIDKSINLSIKAIEEEQYGNKDLAINLLFDSIEQLIKALPQNSGKVKGRLNLLFNKFNETEWESNPTINENKMESNKVSEQLVDAAVKSAILLKKSKIPTYLTSTINYSIDKAKKVEEYICCWCKETIDSTIHKYFEWFIPKTFWEKMDTLFHTSLSNLEQIIYLNNLKHNNKNEFKLKITFFQISTVCVAKMSVGE